MLIPESRLKQTIIFGPAGVDFDTGTALLVRNLVFTCVYYNNGNSLPVFSIPTTRGKLDQIVRRAEVGCASSHLSTKVNRAIDSVFVGDVRAPHLLKAGLLLASSAGRRPVQGTFAIQVQNDLASQRPVMGRATGKRSGSYLPN
jgi:hypothetical protein